MVLLRIRPTNVILASRLPDSRGCLVLAMLLSAACQGPACAFDADPVASSLRPNIVWVLSEDNSKHFLKLFDQHGAETPHIASMAKNGVVFERAFSCAPVCSVARTTLMTSRYAPRIGTQFHRKLKPAKLPRGWKMFPAHLRAAGYYTTNHSKTDYNTAGNLEVWDESSRRASWRKRPHLETPFFHMQTFTMSHESSLHFSRNQMKQDQTETDPLKVQLASVHPSTPTMRYTYARYHDRIRVIDAAVGKLLAQLKDDGLLETTFVFYFGDHGGVLPGSKGYANERGLHVPLVVRVPEKFLHLSAFARGERTAGFVNFTDFGPTVLNLAGVKIPESMDGQSFLGSGVAREDVASRNITFGHADRFDEKYDFVRTVRRGRYKYVRNYHAFYADGLQNNYRYRMLAYQQWRELSRKNALSDVQNAFFKPKAAEALYDLQQDPDETHNLASDPRYKNIKQELQTTLNDRLRAWPDLSFYPESELVEHALGNPVEFGRQRRQQIARLIAIADLALMPFEQAQPELKKALEAESPWEKYTALTVCSVFGQAAQSLAGEARALCADAEWLVRLRAAEFLAILDQKDEQPVRVLRQILRESPSAVTNLIALNTVVFLRDQLGCQFPLAERDIKVKNPEVMRRVQYLTAP